MLTACRLAACVLLPACGPPRAAVIAAEGGPPQIDWQDATLLSNEPVGRGTYQMRVQASEDSPPLGYAAGHILGFEMAHPETGEALKGPYTVTRAPDERQFDVIYRVIPDGRKTPFMEKLTPGAAVRFGGKFGTPIADGIKDDVDRVVGIATGAGLGPLVGYAEATLAGNAPPKVELYGGFRDLADVCCKAECDELAARHPDAFTFTPVISRPMACSAVNLASASAVPSSDLADSLGEGLAAPPSPSFAQGRVSRVVPGMLGEISRSTHFHLVGNGGFVNEMRDGLLAGGIDETRVTTEIYFNKKVEADEDVVAFIAEAIKAGVAQTPQTA